MAAIKYPLQDVLSAVNGARKSISMSFVASRGGLILRLPRTDMDSGGFRCCTSIGVCRLLDGGEGVVVVAVIGCHVTVVSLSFGRFQLDPL